MKREEMRMSCSVCVLVIFSEDELDCVMIFLFFYLLNFNFEVTGNRDKSIRDTTRRDED